MSGLSSLVLPVFAALAISVITGPRLIACLLKLKIGQTVRDDGPKSHLKKNGTPTMGGIMILFSFLCASVPFAVRSREALAILLLTVGFGIVGFADDYIKVVLKRSLGLTPAQKMAGQFAVTFIFLMFLVYGCGTRLYMTVPFLKELRLDFGLLNYPILFFIVLGTTNGTNLTDGVDGLASTVTVTVAGFMAVAALVLKPECAPVAMAMMGALLGFLVFNCHPAKVFMGDTGSLALGGFVAAFAYVLNLQLFLVMVGFVYCMEAISVILQVSWFKLTHGKRIFKMAPIHHHFEKCGWSETRVVTIFSIITFMMCLLALLAL